MQSFYDHGCSCKLGPKQQSCVKQFEIQEINNFRASCLELTKTELDLMVLGHIAALMEEKPSDETNSQKRKRNSTKYYHQGRTVCWATFLFVHGIGKRRLKNLRSHFSSHGLVPCQHGNERRLPWKVTDQEVIKHCIHSVYLEPRSSSRSFFAWQNTSRPR